jgi:hypothetical protein
MKYFLILFIPNYLFCVLFSIYNLVPPTCSCQDFPFYQKSLCLKVLKFPPNQTQPNKAIFRFFVFVYSKTILKMIRPHDDDYKQIKVLGKGAYGEVWLVTNREHQDQQVNSNKKKSIIN